VDKQAWDERYGVDQLIWSAEPNRFVEAETTDLPPGRALDVACGEGRNAVWLAQKGWAVTGVDFSCVALEKARRVAAHRGVEVEWVEADLLDWTPLPDSFDLVLIMYLHLPAEQRSKVYARAASALTPGGTLLVVGHALPNLTDGHGGPKDPAVLFTPDDVVADLADLGGLGEIRIERAELVRRTVDTDAGPVEAIDVLVRASRPRR
jgi:SAM-dependent methyltransferase